LQLVRDDPPAVDSIFTMSILFRNPTKFKIMQNGNQKNEREEFPKSDIIPFTKEELPAVKKRIENSMRKFKEFPPDEPSYKGEESSVTSEESSGDKGKKAPYPCFFLKAVDLYILSNIPNFQA
jgi:hypothetical protein